MCSEHDGQLPAITHNVPTKALARWANAPGFSPTQELASTRPIPYFWGSRCIGAFRAPSISTKT
jgi:hypothetical protein